MTGSENFGRCGLGPHSSQPPNSGLSTEGFVLKNMFRGRDGPGTGVRQLSLHPTLTFHMGIAAWMFMYSDTLRVNVCSLALPVFELPEN